MSTIGISNPEEEAYLKRLRSEDQKWVWAIENFNVIKVDDDKLKLYMTFETELDALNELTIRLERRLTVTNIRIEELTK